MQSTETIKEHLKELYATKSKYPEILLQFIDLWESKLVESAEIEEHELRLKNYKNERTTVNL